MYLMNYILLLLISTCLSEKINFLFIIACCIVLYKTVSLFIAVNFDIQGLIYISLKQLEVIYLLCKIYPIAYAKISDFIINTLLDSYFLIRLWS